MLQDKVSLSHVAIRKTDLQKKDLFGCLGGGDRRVFFDALSLLYQ